MILINNIHYFNQLHIEPDRNSILRRMGYRQKVKFYSQEQQHFLEKGISEGLLLCHPRAAYGRFRITDINFDEVVFGEKVSFRSANLAKLLKNSREVLLMAATVGNEITTRIEKEIAEGEAALGVVLDAVASETADAVLDWMMLFSKQILIREGKHPTKHRFSPGYGDLDLRYQKEIFDLLKLEELSLKLTEKYMLVPEKSVLAIAGIEEGVMRDET